ncbi:PREDICTED: uncharacterized protein LOC107171365 [Diuraphis noxia]|uniref:uncharacterized protein LOC107171365 n=1 Tax=Diuraphis noxia TaxID=143948 RepID=UPI000763B50D|nr:PREDICTED: uncharacterized protein LOC107171365 [Diuraphis noxia]
MNNVSRVVPFFKSPRKTYKRAKIQTELDDFDGDIVRRIIHDFYDRGEYPTALSILNTYREKNNYTKCNDGRKFLMERLDIVALRCTFLRKMCTLRKNNDSHPVVYVDETWVNQNHSRSIIWQNNEGTEGLKVPTGKGGRLIVCHAGCARYGFIKDSKLVFRSNTSNTTDYHNQMNYEVYKEWFLELLNHLEESSINVMDNASYHSTLAENYPESNSRKSDVKKWLNDKNIPYSNLETLAELKMKVKNIMRREKSYLLDELALERGHEVIQSISLPV